jgi:hypothetical protein
VLSYSLTNNAGGRFAINATTGVLTVANGTLLDYESATSHAITVRTTDQGGLTYDKAFTVAVTNVNEAPTNATLSGGLVAAKAASGTLVGTVTGIDPDAGAVLTYSLTNNAGGRFAINATTGALTVANGTLLDYQTATSHAITVRTTDQGGLTFDKPFTIKVVNHNASRDIDGNGKSDILWQNDSGQPSVWLMDGLNPVAEANIGAANPGPTWHATATGDFNGDGKTDILWQNDDGSPGIMLMDGLNQIGAGLVGANPGPAWHVKATGDFNGDGKADILWQNDNGQPSVWLIDGLNVVAGANIGPANPGPTWHAKATGDFNGDGKADVLWQNDDGSAAIWLMDGLNQIGASLVGGNPGPSWHVKATGDFNGDGKADILWQNDNGQPSVWLMDGFTQIGAGNIGPANPGPTWHVKGAGDFNGDGKADILWQNDDGTPAIWLMDGFTQIGASTVGANPGSNWHVIGAGSGTDDTTRVTINDAADNFGWTSFRTDSNAQGNVTFQIGINDGGSSWTNEYDAASVAAWSTRITLYDAANRIVSQTTNNDNGSHVLTANDATNSYNWSTFTMQFDADWNMTSISGANDDGTHTLDMSEIWASFDTLSWYANPFVVSLTPPGNPDGDGLPVILDLDGNGVDVSPLSSSSASFDMDGRGGREHTAWAGNNDGFLAIDLAANGDEGPDGIIDQTKEIVFTQWAPSTRSDMAALRQVFDTNQNGALDSGDARWSEFRVWRDADGDGISQASEMKTLGELGIASINLNPTGPAQTLTDGSIIQGLSSYTRTDGTTGTAGDVALTYDTTDSQVAPATDKRSRAAEDFPAETSNPDIKPPFGSEQRNSPISGDAGRLGQISKRDAGLEVDLKTRIAFERPYDSGPVVSIKIKDQVKVLGKPADNKLGGVPSVVETRVADRVLDGLLPVRGGKSMIAMDDRGRGVGEPVDKTSLPIVIEARVADGVPNGLPAGGADLANPTEDRSNPGHGQQTGPVGPCLGPVATTPDSNPTDALDEGSVSALIKINNEAKGVGKPVDKTSLPIVIEARVADGVPNGLPAGGADLANPTEDRSNPGDSQQTGPAGPCLGPIAATADGDLINAVIQDSDHDGRERIPRTINDYAFSRQYDLHLPLRAMDNLDQINIAHWLDNLGHVQRGQPSDAITEAKLSGLIQAMAAHSRNNNGFDPAMGMQGPHDGALQNTMAASWH